MTDKKIREMIPVKMVCEYVPKHEKEGDAGMDLMYWSENFMTINPMERKLLPTGVRIQLPIGYECQIRPRSGLALKHGITVLNTPGTIDSGYTGEIGVILINLSNTPYIVKPKERIAQMVFSRYEFVSIEIVDELDVSERGDGGFGHTG